eukprot:TRINITY_DN37661_c0_g1_i1.p1 TRINITY_DN37661_c0_g1~~TRINITY_DN37661_c0_g1_i1.p1  ORF type:complete len:614 (+),score=113.97 TRINITY_DN37661_c0_g1_i1:89-1930(+)
MVFLISICLLMCSAVTGEVSRLLFGANLEFTRHDLFEGISAEIISNRKFQSQFGATETPRWELLNGAKSIPSTYRKNGNSIRCDSPNCGIQQQKTGDGYNPGQDYGSSLPLKQGWSYSFRIVLRGQPTSSATVKIDGTEYVSINGLSDSWSSVTKTFTFNSETTTKAILLIECEGLVDIDSVSMVPINNTELQSLRKDVIAALKSLQISGTFRYPGGCYSSVQAVNFTDTLLEPDMVPVVETPPNFCPAVKGGVNAYTDRFMINGISTSTYSDLADMIGSVKSITTRLVMGTAEENEIASNWLAYTESKSLNITHWYLGNEMNVQGRFPGFPFNKTSYPPPSAAEYADMSFAMSQMMLSKSMSPSLIKFYVVSGDKDWLSAIFKKPRFVHAVSFHGGYSNEPATWDPQSATDAAKAPSNFYSSIIDLRSTLNSVGGEYAKISADEWGLGPPWKCNQFGTPHAMYAASILTVMISVQEEANLTAANYFEPINEGSLVVNPFSVDITPVGVVQSLYARHGGGGLVQVSEGNSTEDVILVQTSFPVAITAANRNSTTSSKVTITVPQSGKLTIRTFTSSGYLPNSTFAKSISTISVTGGSPFVITVPAFSVVAADF